MIFRFLFFVVLLATSAAHAAPPCVPNTGYPWPQFGCLKAADLNTEFASIIANGVGTLISAPKPSGGDDRPAIQAFLTANCSKGPILFFGAYNIGYPGLVPPRNCIYGGATTWLASGSGISGYPAPTMFSAFGTWTDNLHCVINQTHDGQYVHDLTLVGNGIVSPQICGIRAMNSVQWRWENVNVFQAYRGKELIGDSNQPCGDSQCWTQVGQIIGGADLQNMAEGLYLFNKLPGEGASSSFVSDLIFLGLQEQNNCNAPTGTLPSAALPPSGACSGIGMYGSVSGIYMQGSFKSEDNFNNDAYGLIAWNTSSLNINGIGFDLNQNAAIWLQNIDDAELNGINSLRQQQLGPGTNCGHIRLTGSINDLRMAGDFFDNTTPIFEGDKGATGFAPTMKYSSIQIALNDGTSSGFDNTGNKLYCPVSSDGVLAQTIVSPSVIGPPNAATFTPGNPTGTTSGTGLMMGLGSTLTLTPAKTGNILVTISGNNANAASITAKYGTGTAPINTAAPTGTSLGVTALSAATGAFMITGLIPAAAVTVPVTPLWVDLDLAATTGTATVTNLAVSLTEQ